eukprot:CAMPEP_0114307598 /NCGR_PEP_ID=MMETSP0059-20121206/17555_1 /TAXON_ID=36894 /ORGANISM="Pyramimonas parkeae, Strain CCMP726" /LENGTH=1016 /DNA_ID=CAMNT_0001431073 /DNA_START=483 /DNA_END=3530 /DNA_ORIENTATION=-
MHAPCVLILINPDKHRMQKEMMKVSQIASKSQVGDQEAVFTYRYKYHGAGLASTWVSAQRFALVDLGAGPCLFCRMGISKGMVALSAFPRLGIVLSKYEGSQTSNDDTFNSTRARKKHIIGAVSNLVVSSIKHLFVPDIRMETSDLAQRILVPIILLRNHDLFNPLVPGHAHSIDLFRIKYETKGLIKDDQELVFADGVHDLHRHERLALAVTRSLKSTSGIVVGPDGKYSMHLTSVLDPQVLLKEMHNTSDMLASGVIGLSNPKIAKSFYNFAIPYNKQASMDKNNKRSLGTHVVPIYVLSLAALPNHLLLDGESWLAVDQDMVVVLQLVTNASETQESEGIQHFINDECMVKVLPQDTTRHIVAGLAKSLAGVASPNGRFSPFHKRHVESYIWAIGGHPFGIYSNSTLVGDLFKDSAKRSSIISKAHMAVRSVQASLNELDQFAANFKQRPFVQHADLFEDWPGAEISWLDSLSKSSQIPTMLPRAIVQRLESGGSGHGGGVATGDDASETPGASMDKNNKRSLGTHVVPIYVLSLAALPNHLLLDGESWLAVDQDMVVVLQLVTNASETPGASMDKNNKRSLGTHVVPIYVLSLAALPNHLLLDGESWLAVDQDMVVVLQLVTNASETPGASMDKNNKRSLGTHVVPIYVLSLAALPNHLLLDGESWLAVDQDMVVVLQLVTNASETPGASMDKNNKRSLGTHVVPIYVLSLAALPNHLLLDGESWLAVDQDMVVVLQLVTNASETQESEGIQHFINDECMVKVLPQDTTRHIVAGLAKSLAGVASPNGRFSPFHKRHVESYIWAIGGHPFGIYSNSTLVGDLFKDSAKRSSIISKAHMAVRSVQASLNELDQFAANFKQRPFVQHADLFEDWPGAEISWLDSLSKSSQIPTMLPRAIVQRLESEFANLKIIFAKLGQNMYDHKLHEANNLASSALIATRNVKEYVVHELYMAVASLRCCVKDHTIAWRDDIMYTYSSMLFIGIIVYWFVIYCVQRSSTTTHQIMPVKCGDST